MLYLIKIKIENKQERYCCIEAEKSSEAKNILQDIDRNVDSKNYYHILEILDTEQIDNDNEKFKELKLENKIIRDFSDWRRNKNKLDLSKFQLSYKISKLLIYIGIGCLTSLFYIKTILELKNKPLLHLSQLQIKNFYLVSHYNSLREILTLICFLGFMLILLGIEVIYFFNKSQKSSNTIKKVISLFLLLTLMIISTGFVLMSNRVENGFIEFLGVTITLWIILTCLNLDSFIKIFIKIANGYINLENKEQFTLGIAIVTFVLGLLLGK